MTIDSDNANGPERPGDDSKTNISRPLSGSSVQIPRQLDAPENEKTIISKSSPSSPSSTELQFRRGVSPSELGNILVGETLGHFQLEEFVGGGGMGAVFRGIDTSLERVVAIKVMSHDPADVETLKRFQNEAQSAARLDHDNIARVYFVGEDKGLNYIVFEFIEGVNIRDLVDHKGPLPIDEAISYTLQVAEALEHAAHRDVVHRDIKPSNILVTADGRAKLVDMGLARLHQIQSSEEDLTQSGVTLGTFDYISPEQARDPRSADVRSDLYSLGCTFYYMLTRSAPFPEGTVLQKLLSHSTDEPPDPREFRPDVDQRIVDILYKLMAKQPTDRFQRPSELISELLLASEQMGLNYSVAKRTTLPTPIKRRRFNRVVHHLPWVIPVAILLVTTSALGLFSQSPASDPIIELPNPVLPNGGADPSPNDPDVGEPNLSTTDTSTQPNGTDTPPNNVVVSNPSSGNNVNEGEGNGNSSNPPVGEGELAALPNVSIGVDAGDGNEISLDASTPRTGPRSSEEASTRTIIVRRSLNNGDVDAVEGEEIVGSLSAAVRMATNSPKPVLIRLEFNGRMEDEPFNIFINDLTIEAPASFQPVVAFTPKLDDYALDGMIRVHSTKLNIRNVHFRFDVPEQVVNSWALFDLQQIESIVLSNSVLTIRNTRDSRPVFHDRVAFFRSPGPSILESTEMPTDEVDMSRPEIRLYNCIARGQATLLRLDRAAAFWLLWEDGLFISSESLLHSHSRATPVKGPVEKIDLELDHVTVIAAKGLAQVDIQPNAPHHMMVSMNLVKSVLVSDAELALYEQRGVKNADDSPDELTAKITNIISMRGRDNIYPNTEILARIDPMLGADTQLTWTAEKRRDYDMWYTERGSLYGQPVIWS